MLQILPDSSCLSNFCASAVGMFSVAQCLPGPLLWGLQLTSHVLTHYFRHARKPAKRNGMGFIIFRVPSSSEWSWAAGEVPFPSGHVTAGLVLSFPHCMVQSCF